MSCEKSHGQLTCQAPDDVRLVRDGDGELEHEQEQAHPDEAEGSSPRRQVKPRPELGVGVLQ
jgi:hypothetical protein